MSTAWSLVMWAAWSLVMNALQKIKGREQEDPDQIHEMPEETRVLDPIGKPLRVGLPQLRARTPEIRVHCHATHHMEHVQPRQREVNGEEVVGAREKMVVELVAVLEILDDEKDPAEQD